MHGVETAPASVMVIFGTGGDLTRRKLLPAIYHLCREDHLPEPFAVLGVDRKDDDDDGYRARIDVEGREFIGAGMDEALWSRLLGCLHFQAGDFSDPQLYTRLAARLGELTTTRRIPPNYLFYFATPPRFFDGIATQLGNAGLLAEEGGYWRRVVIEKPFGCDLASAREMNRVLRAVMAEHQIYRIDHYLGKESVQNMLAYRFASATVEPIWNRRYVDHVQITVSESIGVEQRGTVDMNFRYKDYFDNKPTSGYATLIHDVMTGDSTLFKRADHIEASWALAEPVFDVWSALPPRDFPNYAAGSWGPPAVDELLRRDGRAWRPCKQCHQ